MREGIGATIGALAGAALCNARGGTTAQCVGVAILGAAVGYGIGRWLDQRDQDAYNRAVSQSLALQEADRTPQVVRSEQTGNTLTVTPISSVRNAAGQECRTYNVDYVRGTETYQAEEQRCFDGNRWVPQTAA
jgi:phage tail tape-measure protein